MLLFYVCGCLLMFIAVHHMSTWYPWRPKKHAGPPGTRVTNGCSCHIAASIQIWSFGKAASVVNCQAVSSALANLF